MTNNLAELTIVVYASSQLDIIWDINFVINDKHHREKGPAYLDFHINGGVKTYHYCKQNKLHREDGPAIIRYNKDESISSKWYYLYNKLHRKEKYFKAISPQNRIKVLLNDSE